MSSIEHVLPFNLKPLDGASQGIMRPGLQVAKYDTGYSSSRDWFEYNLKSYQWTLSRMSSTSLYLEEFRAFLDAIRVGGGVCWVKEALVDRDPQVVLSPLGDGSRTSWVLPMRTGATLKGVTKAGQFVPAADYTTHNAANILTDAQANAVGATTGMAALAGCAIASVEFPVADGRSSFRVTPSGAAADLGLETSTKAACAASQTYTFFAAFRGTGEIRIDGDFYTAGGAQTGAAVNATGTMVETGWTILAVQGVSDADAATAYLKATRTTSSSAVFHVACLGIIPGDLEQWFLPSESPMVIEFDSAPANRARILAAADCTRMTRCRLAAKSASTWRLESPGSAYGAVFSALEELE